MNRSLKTFLKFFEPFPDVLKSEKKQGGTKITFVEWYHYVLRAHRQFPEGYSKSVSVTTAKGFTKDGDPTSTLIVTCRITDHATGIHQEALGSADAGKSSWGGAIAEAESQAFRRAMANWGMGLEMYLDDDDLALWMQVAEEDSSEIEEPNNNPTADGLKDPDDDEDAEDENGDPIEDPDDDLPFDQPDSPVSERMLEVLTILGPLLDEYADENDDDDVSAFVHAQRLKLEKGLTHKRCGVVIAKFRAKLEELGIEDPTQRDDD